MNTDIRIDVNFRNNPKTKKLKKRLGLESIDSLMALWIWVAVNRPDGDLAGMDVEDIEIVAEWEGSDGIFVSTLHELRWLDKDGDFYEIHDWSEHQPWASQQSDRSDKARFSRLASINPTEHKRLVNEGKTSVTKEEYKSITKAQRSFNGRSTVVNDSLTPAPSPTPNVITTPLPPMGERYVLPEWVPKDLFQDFKQMRQKKKKPLTDRATQLAIANLTTLRDSGEDIPAVIKQSILHSWDTFYTLKDNRVGTQHREAGGLVL